MFYSLFFLAQNHMSDHNYCLHTTDAEEGFSETIATIDVEGKSASEFEIE